MEEIENILETLSFRDAIQLEMGNDKILPDVVKEAFAAAGKREVCTGYGMMCAAWRHIRKAVRKSAGRTSVSFDHNVWDGCQTGDVERKGVGLSDS